MSPIHDATTTLLMAGFAAAAVTIVLVLALRPLALEIGLADEPGGRKRHSSRVPVVGGLAMIFGFHVGLSLMPAAALWGPVDSAIWLLAAVGVIDDRFDLNPGIRVLAQAVAAMLVVFGAGLVVGDLGEPLFFSASLGLAGPLVTMIVIVTIVNGFNLIDGMDGLAGGTALVSLAALAWIGGGSDVFATAVLLSATVAGFLALNLPLRATRGLRVFMGDAGSTWLGFAVACLGIALSQGEGARIAPVVGLWIAAIPIYEVLAASWRRLKEGRAPWLPDDSHLHHRLLARGISTRRTLVFMLSLAVAFAAAGVLGHGAGLPDGAMFAAWLICGRFYYRITRRPNPVVSWVRSWKHNEPSEAALAEAAAGHRERGD